MQKAETCQLTKSEERKSVERTIRGEPFISVGMSPSLCLKLRGSRGDRAMHRARPNDARGPSAALASSLRQPTNASSSCPCFDGGDVFFAGFSELRHVFDAVLESLECTDEDADLYDNHRECNSDQSLIWHFGNKRTGLSRGHKGMRDSLCREAAYSVRPYVARCRSQGYDFRVHFEWKSFQASARDLVHLERIRAAAARGGRVLVVLAGGLHDFTAFRAISEAERSSIPASMQWPQEWVDHFTAGTFSLFEKYSRANLPDNVCVVFKGSNIATQEVGRRNKSRSVPLAGSTAEFLPWGETVRRGLQMTESGEYGRWNYHPSAVGGLSDWLNKIAFAIAPRYGIPVIDQTPLTLSMRPVKGDIYHGYPDGVLANNLFSQSCAACGARLGGTCTLPISPIAGAAGCPHDSPCRRAPPRKLHDVRLTGHSVRPDLRALSRAYSDYCECAEDKARRAGGSPYKAPRKSVDRINLTAVMAFRGWRLNVSELRGSEIVWKVKNTCPLPCVGEQVPGYTVPGYIPN